MESKCAGTLTFVFISKVCEEDILRALADTPCQSEVMSVETSDDHPLRVLSEENLTCASTFTGKLELILP